MTKAEAEISCEFLFCFFFGVNVFLMVMDLLCWCCLYFFRRQMPSVLVVTVRAKGEGDTKCFVREVCVALTGWWF